MLHILVAEDNALNRMVLTRLLARLGCTCDTVETGREVLAAVQGQQYDLVLMDVRMPEMNGIEATLALHLQLPPAACPPVYAVTAGVSPEEQKECLAAGMAGFVVKPVDLEALRTLLATLQPRAG